jgi:hypothetical protein
MGIPATSRRVRLALAVLLDVLVQGNAIASANRRLTPVSQPTRRRL